MFLEVVGVGRVELCGVERDDDWIRVYSATRFRELWPKTIYPVKEALMLSDEDNSEWELFVEVDVPENPEIYIDDAKLLKLKNQEEIQRLNAFL